MALKNVGAPTFCTGATSKKKVHQCKKFIWSTGGAFTDSLYPSNDRNVPV